MAVVQSAYNESMAIAAVGLVANMETANSISRIVEDAEGIGFGKAVFQGTGDTGVTAEPGTQFRGITIRDNTLEVTSADEYPEGATAGVLEKGVIWVTAGEAVTAGAPVYVTDAGAFVDTVGSNTQLAGVIFDSSAANGALVKVRLGANIVGPQGEPGA